MLPHRTLPALVVFLIAGLKLSEAGPLAPESSVHRDEDQGPEVASGEQNPEPRHSLISSLFAEGEPAGESEAVAAVESRVNDPTARRMLDALASLPGRKLGFFGKAKTREEVEHIRELLSKMNWDATNGRQEDPLPNETAD